jgi:uncharacterized protein YegP (UPF0339 family)
MATATPNGRPARGTARRASPGSESPAFEFLVIEDNGGGYHWTIADGAGQSLVQSRRFASHDEAQRAAVLVRDNAGAARLEHRAPADAPTDLVEAAAK